ncbi:MAG: hypothetical protein ACFFC7_12155 [Candidatus Hermodarchaeota archaeon]
MTKNDEPIIAEGKCPRCGIVFTHTLTPEEREKAKTDVIRISFIHDHNEDDRHVLLIFIDARGKVRRENVYNLEEEEDLEEKVKDEDWWDTF